ncbi:9236_t:CDS:2 [Paraglomus occultum]|uniref:9236_t:CDS:1 n=1 Tax=Paraglomus occultum TaxID=144539 RepID=A0A9N8VGL7_9GLOM|nr:9236_t:CDS:2 [Paraglomus occultum]
MPRRKYWTPSQDYQLREFVETHGPRWGDIARVIGNNTTGKQCRERYRNHLDRKINHSKLTLLEQAEIYRLYEKHGSKWALIAAQLPGRTSLQVRNFYYNVRRIAKRRDPARKMSVSYICGKPQ